MDNLLTEKEANKYLKYLNGSKIGFATINKNNHIMFNGNFLCKRKEIQNLEYSFYSIKGDVDLRESNLLSLKGLGDNVHGNFHSGPKLTSLEHMPKKIKGNIYISNSRLENLNGLDHIKNFNMMIINKTAFANGIDIEPFKKVFGIPISKDKFEELQKEGLFSFNETMIDDYLNDILDIEINFESV